jgi:CBS domain-containing protein
MKSIREIMTSDVRAVPPDCTIRQAASMLRDHDIGCLPVCENDRLVGMITDRDVTIRCVAEGLNPDTMTARDIMSGPAVCCFDDQDLTEAARIMSGRKVRRIVVLNRAKRMVGVVSLGDIALASQSQGVAGETLRAISGPGLRKAA